MKKTFSHKKHIINTPLLFVGFVFIMTTSLFGCSNENAEPKVDTGNMEAIQPTVVASTKPVHQDTTEGETAHKAHCYKCHTDQVYIRESRFVKSIDALSKQVVRCKEGSDVPWFEEDTAAVVQFLNQKYYKF